jgi:hypothetical protein
MDKNVSIVKVDKRPYRVIAQENWGLTDEQMQGMHVHHRVHQCRGGKNDPSNLYVCSPSFHWLVWHNGDGWLEWAGEIAKKIHIEKDEQGKSVHAVRSGKKAHAKKDEHGKSLHALKLNKKLHEQKDEYGRSVHAVKYLGSVHAEKDENGKSVHGVKAGKASHTERDEQGKSILAIKNAKKMHSNKDELGRSVHGVRSSKHLNGQLWESMIDGFKGNAGNVAKHNRSNGWDPKARVRIG